MPSRKRGPAEANDRGHAAMQARPRYADDAQGQAGVPPDLEWDTRLLRFKHPDAQRAHCAHKAAFRRFNLQHLCFALAAVEGVATVNAMVWQHWSGAIQLAITMALLLAVVRVATQPRVSDRMISHLCVGLAAAIQAVFVALLLGNAAGFANWSMLHQGVTPLTFYATLITTLEFLLAPYWFLNIDAVLEAVRVMCMVAVVSYLVHVSILELFASPTAGLLSAVAHDFGTPLTTFSLGLQLLLIDPDITPAMRQVLDMQVLAVEAMNAVRQRALDASAYSEGHIPSPTLSVDDPRSLVKRWHVEDAVAQYISTDFSWDMLLKLLHNAKQHAAGTMCVATAVTVSDDGTQLRFSVRDFGAGVPQLSACSLFRKFPPLGAALKAAPRGGLGLSLHDLSIKVRALGGTCGITHPSQPHDASLGSGPGAEFWFSVPYVPAPAAASDRSVIDSSSSMRFKGNAAAGVRLESGIPVTVVARMQLSAQRHRAPAGATPLSLPTVTLAYLAQRRPAWEGLVSLQLDAAPQVAAASVLPPVAAAATMMIPPTTASRPASLKRQGTSPAFSDTGMYWSDASAESHRTRSALLSSIGGGSCQSKKVLVVDDEASIRKFLANLLKKNGYDVVLARDGEEGLQAMCSASFHAVLLDLNMPRMGGMAAMAALREWEREQKQKHQQQEQHQHQQQEEQQQQQQQPHQPGQREPQQPQFIIVVSANCSEAQQEAALAGGADLFHPKPIVVPALAAAAAFAELPGNGAQLPHISPCKRVKPTRVISSYNPQFDNYKLVWIDNGGGQPGRVAEAAAEAQTPAPAAAGMGAAAVPQLRASDTRALDLLREQAAVVVRACCLGAL
ncbi:hypothetical protein JKP88DRAFT_274614 [Tribonema minus]|uniref:Response regulatory domain-containing protein n=1 Tax=Tribonema minus TaxID=303371 RepID=A0A836C8G8_9STRA|nr:hypothetical protein JKP88DRAFT_274614 [Tribonema minus]